MLIHTMIRSPCRNGDVWGVIPAWGVQQYGAKRHICRPRDTHARMHPLNHSLTRGGTARFCSSDQHNHLCPQLVAGEEEPSHYWSSCLWDPSQKGFLLEYLHWHRNASLLCSGVNFIGLKEVPVARSSRPLATWSLS